MTQPRLAREIETLRLHRATSPVDIRSAFSSDPQRFSTFSLTLGDLLLDWSKTAVSVETMELLLALGQKAGIEEQRSAMFSGERINITEGRSVLHVALRNVSHAPVMVGGIDVMTDVRAVLDDMQRFAVAVRSGQACGATGKPITDIVNIGIGGSDLGPAMATQALAPWHDGPRTHYVSNVDGAHIHDTLKALKPETTLFIIASKTFTTIETMTNAQTARGWLEAALGQTAVAAHFVAVSTALDTVAAFGIAPERVFGFWDWVGGRYSLWSAIGLPLMIAIGPANFWDFLAGAHKMDKHFQAAPLLENLPVIMGFIGYWHRVICGYPARAVIPYDQRLARLPAYLQQLDMESNGKSVMLDGKSVVVPTGPLVWGEPGTNGQHAFFQLLHQGTDIIPIEFLAAAEGHEPGLRHHHDLLLANCLAQSQALMKGRSLDEAVVQMRAKGLSEADISRIAPHRVFAGNRPSMTILYGRLDPYTLGQLIALYEHRVFVEAGLFGINAFDQWGVELGKELASGLLPVIEEQKDAGRHDASTAGLVRHIHGLRDAK